MELGYSLAVVIYVLAGLALGFAFYNSQNFIGKSKWEATLFGVLWLPIFILSCFQRITD